MSELPASWVEVTLGDFTVDSTQRVPATDEQFQYVDIASIDRLTKRITSPQLLWGRDAPSRARKEIRAGDVLVSMTRPNLNAVALVPPEFDRQIASTGFDVLRSTGVEPRWLFYIVRTQSFIDRMSEQVQGALYPAVRSKDVRSYVAPLAPLGEQKRIADKLDAVLARIDACRERLDRVPDILKRFRQAVLAIATSGKLTEEWRASNETERWLTVKLSEVAKSRLGKMLDKAKNRGIATPYLRNINVRWFGFDLSDIQSIRVTEDEARDLAVNRGDVLICEGGEPGRCAVWRGEDGTYVYQKSPTSCSCWSGADARVAVLFTEGCCGCGTSS